MPGMDERVLAQRLAAGRTIKVLFMSGYAENVIAYRGVLDGGVNYVQKAFTRSRSPGKQERSRVR